MLTGPPPKFHETRDILNACVLWTTTYLADALDALRDEDIDLTDELVAHLTPAQPDQINFSGTYSLDIDAELQREGRRPLRASACPRKITKTTRFAPLLSRPRRAGAARK